MVPTYQRIFESVHLEVLKLETKIGTTKIHYQVDQTGKPERVRLSGLPDSEWPSFRNFQVAMVGNIGKWYNVRQCSMFLFSHHYANSKLKIIILVYSATKSVSC
jgi:hypothetical protein